MSRTTMLRLGNCRQNVSNDSSTSSTNWSHDLRGLDNHKPVATRCLNTAAALCANQGRRMTLSSFSAGSLVPHVFVVGPTATTCGTREPAVVHPVPVSAPSSVEFG